MNSKISLEEKNILQEKIKCELLYLTIDKKNLQCKRKQQLANQNILKFFFQLSKLKKLQRFIDYLAFYLKMHSIITYF